MALLSAGCAHKGWVWHLNCGTGDSRTVLTFVLVQNAPTEHIQTVDCPVQPQFSVALYWSSEFVLQCAICQWRKFNLSEPTKYPYQWILQIPNPLHENKFCYQHLFNSDSSEMDFNWRTIVFLYRTRHTLPQLSLNCLRHVLLSHNGFDIFRIQG